ASGRNHSCAVRGDGDVYCWTARDTRAAPAPVRGALSIAAAGDDTCAVLRTGRVACWGKESEKIPTESNGREAPFSIPNVADAVSVMMSPRIGCALLRDERVACWMLAEGVAVDVPGLAGVSHAALNQRLACGSDAQGAVRCQDVEAA